MGEEGEHLMETLKGELTAPATLYHRVVTALKSLKSQCSVVCAFSLPSLPLSLSQILLLQFLSLYLLICLPPHPIPQVKPLKQDLLPVSCDTENLLNRGSRKGILSLSHLGDMVDSLLSAAISHLVSA